MCPINLWALVRAVRKRRRCRRAGQCLGWLQAHSVLESTGAATSLRAGQSHFMTKSNTGILTSMQSKTDPKDPAAVKSVELHLPPKVEPTLRWVYPAVRKFTAGEKVHGCPDLKGTLSPYVRGEHTSWCQQLWTIPGWISGPQSVVWIHFSHSPALPSIINRQNFSGFFLSFFLSHLIVIFASFWLG